MSTHIAAIAFTLAVFLGLGIAYFGWGKIASIGLGIGNRQPESAVLDIWMGWAFTLFIFQLLNFIFPINIYVTLPIFLLGVIVSIPEIVNRLRNFARQIPSPFIMAVTVIPLLGVAAWVAARAMLPPTHLDSGLYHLHLIRWIETYPIVPGLGNLHGRLAFNQSFFTYVAALNFHPFFGYGRSLANSFLLLLLLATILPSLFTAIRKPSRLTREHLFLYAPSLFVLPILVYLAFSSEGLASPSPDLTATLLQLTMFVILAQAVGQWIEGQREQDDRAKVLVVLAATAITIKLSNLAFAAVVIGFSLFYLWKSSPSGIRGVVRAILPISVLFIVWGARGFMLSGAPLYPSTIGYVPVEWAVPIEKITDEANWVYSWAREPKTHWRKVLSNWNWVGGWSQRMLKNDLEVVYPLAFFTVFAVANIGVVAFSYLQKISRPRYLEYIIILPPLAGLIYWFLTAPDPRFAHAAFWLISLSSVLLFLSSLQSLVNRHIFFITFWIVFAVSNLHFIGYALHSGRIENISTAGWYPVKEIPLVKKVTRSGLVVYTPKEDDRCWDSPLPCTPYFNENLRLRNPENLASGFTVKK